MYVAQMFETRDMQEFGKKRARNTATGKTQKKMQVNIVLWVGCD